MSEKIDLTPAVLDLVLYAGDGADFEVIFTDESNDAIDVSDLSWAAQIRKTRVSEEAATLEITTDDAATGIIVVHISAEVSRGLAKTSQWDLQSTSVSRPDPVTVLQGTVTCNPDVTRVPVGP